MTTLKEITVVVVDDHKLIREMWKTLLSSRSKIKVTDDCGTFDEAIELIDKKKPAIVLLDINLPPASGLDAVPLIRKNHPLQKLLPFQCIQNLFM